MTLTTVDSSVLIAALQRWHAAHVIARPVLGRPRLHLIAHVLMESYANLTGLAGQARTPPRIAADTLDQLIREEPLTLSADGHRRALKQAAAAGIMGGAIYDALVAATAREADARLVSLDRRAARTYDAIGVRYELLDS
jgi:predicted nucleic acid-binding protein